jgi:hypothetical protein
MTTPRTIFLIASSLTAGSALVAAGYWYASSLPTAPKQIEIAGSVSDVPEQYAQSAFADIDSIHFVMTKAARLNKFASIWSALAAIFGAAAAIASLFL